MVILTPWLVTASRKDSACSIYNIEEKWCNIISNNYTEPFCVTNFHESNQESSDTNYARTCILPALTNKLSLKKSEQFSTRIAIQEFCSALLWNSDSWRIYFAKPSDQIDSWDWRQTFDSHQSIFLYALCTSFSENGETPFITQKSSMWWIFKWNIVNTLKLQQISDWKDLCSIEAQHSINDCDMSIYATKIYASIMSDLFKIMYAQVLNIDDSENFESIQKTKIENFMSWYFMIHDPYETLITTYPKTIKELESNQKSYKNVLNNLSILDNTKLSNLADKSNCPIDKHMTEDNFIACALHSAQWNGFSLNPAFVTLLYNEILHYRLFIQYYETWPHKQNDNKNLQQNILDFRLYANKQIEATKLAEHNLEEFTMSYPLHIRTLMYTEKVESFRNKSLSPIITSFYSLSEKLQNVQIPN